MDLSNYYDLRTLSGLAVSPDGERVAFTTTEYDEVEDERVSGLFVAPADGSGEPHRLTRASGAGSPAWSPDGERLAFTATRDRDTGIRIERDGDEEEGENGDDEPSSQVWVFDLARGGDARQVTERDRGVAEFDWSPDGERLVVAARDPTEDQEAYLDGVEDGEPIEVERLQHKQDGMGWLDDVRTYLFVVDVETREETRLDEAYGTAAGTDGTSLSPAWGESGIAFLSKRERRPDDQKAVGLYTIQPDGTGLDRVTGDEVSASAPAWGPDGARLAFVGGNPTDWYEPPEVYVTGERGYASVSGGLDRPVARYAGLSWVDDETLLTAFGDEGRTRLALLDADGEDEPSWTFGAQGDFESVRHLGTGGKTVALSVTDPSAGHDAYALSASALDDGEPERLTHLNRPLTRETPTPTCEDVRWENEDGDELHGYLYLPRDYDGDEELPLVTSIHGGPIAYDDPAFSFDTLHWTTQGYAVFRPNYRGSSSYGYEFSAAIAGEWGPKETHDVIAGVERLVESGVADADRLFATGFSYGGITTGYLVAETDMFAAGAAEHGLYDYRSAFGTDDCQNWWEADFGLPWDEEEQYDASSSIRDVDQMETPLLITAGESDWRCPPTQSEQLYVSLKKRDVPAKLVVYQDEHHAIGSPDRAIHRLEAIDAWFDEYDPEASAE
ncbi:alpha/beta hydrolase family protein [Halocalculus aciditolerans]|uniref:Peptidase n=1 Tax=Halocalculus aciditolerans TaxID=1383812 RepID=A0A830FMC2_9EURY|nr:S9 family peptidase [Halocalculus aciditolerans]GGL60488.1 peptidase [Halocalculus aciditolerans]